MALLLGCRAEVETREQPPSDSGIVVPRVDNIVLVTIDTLRADVIGTYGGAAQTPVLDSLAVDQALCAPKHEPISGGTQRSWRR